MKLNHRALLPLLVVVLSALLCQWLWLPRVDGSHTLEVNGIRLGLERPALLLMLGAPRTVVVHHRTKPRVSFLVPSLEGKVTHFAPRHASRFCPALWGDVQELPSIGPLEGPYEFSSDMKSVELSFSGHTRVLLGRDDRVKWVEGTTLTQQGRILAQPGMSLSRLRLTFGDPAREEDHDAFGYFVFYRHLSFVLRSGPIWKFYGVSEVSLGRPDF